MMIFSSQLVQLDDEPLTYIDAINSPMKDKWINAINSELNSLKENNTWSEIRLPPEKHKIQTRWLFKIKKDINNNPVRYKARLVAKGYEQEQGIDYNETFAPVVKIQSLRLLITIAVNEGLEIHHIDISTAFLYGELTEEVYFLSGL